MTLELGRTRTWRLPRFSALTMLLRQSDCRDESVRQVLCERADTRGRFRTRTDTRMMGFESANQGGKKRVRGAVHGGICRSSIRVPKGFGRESWARDEGEESKSRRPKSSQRGEIRDLRPKKSSLVELDLEGLSLPSSLTFQAPSATCKCPQSLCARVPYPHASPTLALTRSLDVHLDPLQVWSPPPASTLCARTLRHNGQIRTAGMRR